MKKNNLNIYFFAKALAIALLVSVSPLAFGQPLRVGSSEYPDLPSALKVAVGRTVLIETPQIIESNLKVPADVHLLFRDRGKLVKAKDANNVKVSIEGSISAPIMRTIFERFEPGEVHISTRSVKEVYPQWWGAKADGQHDDTKAVQSAIYGSAVIYLPKGNYLLTKPLDATNKRDGFKLYGQSWLEMNGAVLIGDTGGVVLDMTGSAGTRLEDFYITAGKTNPATIGILYGRSMEYSGSEPHRLERVRVDFSRGGIPKDGSKQIGVYNRNAEGWTAYDCFFNGDNAIVFSSNNIYNIKSPYVENRPGSMTWVSLISCQLMGQAGWRPKHNGEGSAVVLQETAHVQFVNCMIAGSKSFPSLNAFALDLYDDNYGIWLTGDFEGGYYRFMRIRGRLFNSVFRASFTGMSYPKSDPVIYIDGTGSSKASMTNCTVDLGWFVRKRKPDYIFLKTAGENVEGVFHSKMFIYEGAKIHAQQGAFVGNEIHSLHSNPEIRVNEKSNYSYLLFSPEGIKTISGKD